MDSTFISIPLMFKAPRLKVARADALLAEFTAKTAAFLETQPYVCRLVETSHRLAVVGEVRSLIPDELSLILGDAVHNLRSALDVVANDALCKETKSAKRRAYFPIAHDREYFESEGVKKLPRASAQLINIVRQVQPFQENASSWLQFLHDADLQDKHRITAPAVGNPSVERIVARQLHTNGTIVASGTPIDPSILGPQEIISSAKSMNLVYEALPEPLFFFAFTQDHAKARISVDQAFSLMRAEVMRVIELIEALFPEPKPLDYGSSKWYASGGYSFQLPHRQIL